MAEQCSHGSSINQGVKPRTKGCEECLKMGDTWVHLRMCLECGHVAAATPRRTGTHGDIFMRRLIR